MTVSGTVEMLFRTHTDASRGVANTLIPQGCGWPDLAVSPYPARACIELPSVSSVPLAIADGE